jgi:hypothetical protein
MSYTIEEVIQLKNNKELAYLRLECPSSSGGKHWTISQIDYVNKKIDVEYGAIHKSPNLYPYILSQFESKMKEKLKKGYKIVKVELDSRSVKKPKKVEKVTSKSIKIEDSRSLIEQIGEIF